MVRDNKPASLFFFLNFIFVLAVNIDKTFYMCFYFILRIEIPLGYRNKMFAAIPLFSRQLRLNAYY